MEEKDTASYRQDKWLAVGLWLVLFVLILFASMGMIVPVNTINGLNYYASLANHRMSMVFPISSSVFLIILAGLLINIWTNFFSFTRKLFITLAKGAEGLSPNSIFYIFLTFPRPKVGSEDEFKTPLPEDAKGSVVGTIIRRLAICYLLLFVAILLVAIFPLYFFR